VVCQCPRGNGGELDTLRAPRAQLASSCACVVRRKHKVKQRGRENIQPGLAWQSRQGEQRPTGAVADGVVRYSKVGFQSPHACAAASPRGLKANPNPWRLTRCWFVDVCLCGCRCD